MVKIIARSRPAGVRPLVLEFGRNPVAGRDAVLLSAKHVPAKPPEGFRRDYPRVPLSGCGRATRSRDGIQKGLSQTASVKMSPDNVTLYENSRIGRLKLANPHFPRVSCVDCGKGTCLGGPPPPTSWAGMAFMTDTALKGMPTRRKVILLKPREALVP
jgi:hypothetical protein